MRIGIFGGTFDPPHIGHLIAAQEVHVQLGLDRLLLMPAAVPPHKQDEVVTPGALRAEMLRAAVGDDGRFEVSELELDREGPSYTVDTLRELRTRYPDAGLYLAVGADQMAEFGSWREPDAIAELATLVTFGRSGKSPDTERWPVTAVDVPELDLSSTMVRDRVRDGRPIRYLVAPAVEAMIRELGLYR
ncbi:MAG: nicotinate-nucleotide adenylyltransferase [Longimicrobiales bacterium]